MQGRDFPSRVRSLGRALRHRNYRLFFTGQSISLIGTWLTKVATSWLVYRLTGSAWLLGVVGFAGQIPTFFVAPFAGVLSERWNRRRILLTTQTLAMLQSGALAALALSGVIRVWEVVALSVVQGIIDGFDMPVRQSLVAQMVDDRADLPNAIALNSSVVNAARLLGPAIAGVLIAVVGEGWCFAIDALSYAAVVVSLLLMRIDTQPQAPNATRMFQAMFEGFRYAGAFTPLRALLLLLAATGLVGRPFAVLLPVIAHEVMHGGAGTLGALQSTAGVGALAGAIYLASRTSIVGLGSVVAVSAAVFGLGLAAFSQAHALRLAMPLLFLAGVGMMVQTAASNTIIQTIVDEAKRGRVMSLLAMSLFGTVPLGSLIAGALSTRIGAENTILVGGASCVIASALFLLALPEVGRAVQTTHDRAEIVAPTTENGVPTGDEMQPRGS